MTPLAIRSTGMVTGVGWSTEASCAAIRVGITGFVETQFLYDGEFIQGCPVPFETPFRGRAKLVEMAVLAIEEAISPLVADRHATKQMPLLLCLSEYGRPGRFTGLDHTLLRDIAGRVGLDLHDESCAIAEGRVGGVKALNLARQIMERRSDVRRVLICGMDTLLASGTLNHYHERRRLLTADNSDGFIPGEAACAVLVEQAAAETPAVIAVTGIGFGEEPAPIDSEKPLRADGLVAAIKQAMIDAGVNYSQLAYRLTDNSGEQYGYKEAALAMARVVRPVKPEFDILHPADCIGEVGAATVPLLLATASMAERKKYAPGRFMGDGVICHVGADDPPRAAFVIRALSSLLDKGRRAA